MKIKKILIFGILLAIITIGAVSAADNATQDDLTATVNDSSDSLDDGNDIETLSATESGTDILTTEDSSEFNDAGLLTANETSYDGKYYLFRGDCWSIVNNFESSAAVTSETFTDLTVTGTFRTENDIIGLYWYSKDPIQHPYISYGDRSDYSDVVLEFDYNMTGCMDFSNVSIEIAANTGEIYYLTMSRFIENGHFKLDFNNLTLLINNTYYDKDGNPVRVNNVTKLNVTDLKYIKFLLLPPNYVGDFSKYTIMNNTDFTCKISNITVANGEICDEQPQLDSHQYRLCEGYDDTYNLNPFRLSREMRKLGYTEWVDLYVGASYFYEKNGIIGDVITEMNFNHDRTEKMVLDKNVALNKAFEAWLDCYSRELKNNNVTNLIISLSMENLQCPESWRQMDAKGNYAMTGWEPETFFYSPCNDEVIAYMQNVSEACLDIVVNNGLKPILQLGEAWWWWNEQDWQNLPPCFYDNATKDKYYNETGEQLPVYTTTSMTNYDKNVTQWLNQQLVHYSDALREVVKSSKYENGLYMALFFPPSIIDSDRVPQMMRDVNFITDAYSPSKLDVLQIEDYDWVIFDNMHHEEAYTIGQELGFNESQLHYFGGFVQYHEHADKYWPKIQKAMDDAIEKGFKEVYVWAGTQVRRDDKIIGYDEYAILNNLVRTNQPGIVSPIITAPDYVSTGENFTIKMQTNEWINGHFDVYTYKDGERGELLASNEIINGSSSVVLSSTTIGLNKFYLDFNYTKGSYHLIHGIYIIENSKNITVNVSDDVESGTYANITFNGPKNSSSSVYISVDEKEPVSYQVNNGEFATTISNLSDGYHAILVKYNDGTVVGDKLVGEVYYNTFQVKVGLKSIIEAINVTTKYASGENLTVTLKNRNGTGIAGKDLLIILGGSNHTVTTDSNGQATLTIDLLPDNYTAEISFAGDDTYISSSASVNVTVNKLESNLTSNDINVRYSDEANLVITLKDENDDPLSENITVHINGKNSTVTTDSEGKATVPIEELPGNYTAEITYAGSNTHLPASATADVIINQLKTNLTSNNINVTYSDEANLIITLIDEKDNLLSNKSITVNINGENHTVTTNNDGKATLTLDELPGNYTAEITYAGDNVYLPTSTSADVIIHKLKTELTSNDINVIYTEEANLIITLKDEKDRLLTNKSIAVDINGTPYTRITDNEGKATITLDQLPGNYTANINFNEDEVYKASNTTSNIIINKLKTDLSSNNINVIYSEDAILTITLKDEKDRLLNKTNIIVNINGENHTLTTDDGKATLTLDELPGNYTAEITYAGDNVYLPTSTSADVIIHKLKTELTSNDINVIYSEDAILTITLKDEKNRLLTNKNITVNINGENHTVTTDNDGNATLTIDLLPGNYTANINFNENEVYKASNTTSNIIINKLKTNLTSNNINVIYTEEAKLIIILNDEKDNLLSDKNITISMNGTNHTVTTDNDGKATLTIDLLPGNFTAEITYAGSNVYLPSSTSAEVIINKLKTDLSSNDINVIYSEDAILTMTLKDEKDRLLTNKSIAIDINGTPYTRITDNEGKATITLDQLPGNYTAEISFPEDNVYLPSNTSSNIIINKLKTELTANNINVIYSEDAILTITLKDEKDRLLTNKSITVDINGTPYTRITDNEGKATITLDQLPGNYTANINFNENEVYKASNTTSNIIINKLKTELTSNNINVIYSEDAILTITLKDEKDRLLTNKNIKININGTNHTVTTGDDGKATLTIDLLPGNYTAEISFPEDKVYLPSHTSSNIIINKLKTELTANNINVIYSEDAILTITLKDEKDRLLSNKNVLINLAGTNHTVITDNDGKATLTIDLLPGNYTANINFNENEVYKASNTTSNIIINKLKTELTSNNINVIYSEDAKLTITLKDEKDRLLSNKNVTVNINGTKHILTTIKGQATLIIDLLPENYIAEISFPEDNVYLPSNTSSNIIINKLKTELTSNNINIIYGDNAKLTITLKDEKNNLLSSKNITVNINGTIHTITTISKGQATLAIDLLPENYLASISFSEDEKYKASNTTSNIIINKITCQIIAPAISTTYNVAKDLKITLIDERNNLLAEKSIIINLNNKVYNLKTDANGQVKVSVSLPVKEYAAKITFEGSEIYKSSTYSTKVVVTKATPKLVASSKTFKAKAKTKKVTATLKSNTNKIIKNTLVKLTVNKKTYKAKTNSKGVATFKVKLTKKGKYNAVLKYAGNSNYKSINKKIKITIK